MAEQFESTTDSALAAACCALHHEMRKTDPAVWFSEPGEKPKCSYFFEAGQRAPLTISEIKQAWDSGGAAFDKAEQYLLSFVPEDQRHEAAKILHAAVVDGMAIYVAKYKGDVIPLMNRTKLEAGLIIERRGNKTLVVGRNLSEDKIALLKREGNF